MRHLKKYLHWTKAEILFSLAALMIASPARALTTTITSAQPSTAVTNSTSITFEFISSAPDARFVCGLDDDDPSFCTSPMTYRNLLDGNHKFKVFAVSQSEGTDYVGDNHLWRIDTVPPTTTLKSTATGFASYSIELFSSEANSTFLCSLDGDPPSRCTSPASVSIPLSGTHSFRGFAVDEATNMDPVGAEFVFIVDQRPPLTTTITSIFPQAEFTNSTSITFGFVASQADATFVCSLGGAPVACASPLSYQSLPDGSYQFKVQAVDRFGALDPVGALYAWTVDTISPHARLDRADTTSTTMTISWTTDEPATTDLQWGLDGNVDRTVPGDSRFTTSHTVRVSGLSSNTPYSVAPGGMDRAGNLYRMAKGSVRTKR